MRQRATSASVTNWPNAAELWRRYGRLDLEGLTPREKEEYLQIQLRSVFVEQSVRDNPPPFDYPKEVLQRLREDNDIDPDDFPDEAPLSDVQRESEVYYNKTPRPALDVLTQQNSPHVVILGDRVLESPHSHGMFCFRL